MTELAGPITRFANALGAEMSSAVVLELIEQLKSPYDIDFAESSMIYKFNQRGVALTFAHQVLSEVMIFTQAQLTPDAGTTFLPFPIAPVNGLDAAATRAEVIEHFGAPQIEDEAWVRYAQQDRLLWFGFNEANSTSVVTLTFLDPFMVDGAPRTEPASSYDPQPETSPSSEPEPSSEPAPSEPAAETAQNYLNGAHRIDAESQTVVFHADGLLLSFVHMFADTDITTQFNNRFWSGGIVATRLDGNQITIQISPEAAAELGLPSTFEFNVDPSVVQDCYQGLEQMLRATSG